MRNGVLVRPVVNNRDLKKFIRFPYRLYRNHPSWVPPLLSEQKKLLDFDHNPFFKHASAQYFLAFKDNRVCGRIAAMVDNLHNQIHQERTGFFGFFETVEDYSVAEALLAAARDWVREQAMQKIRGPANPSLNEDCGMLTDSFDSPPVVMMTYNPPYYLSFIERFGFSKAMDMYAYLIDGEGEKPKRMVELAEKDWRKGKVVLRPINMKDYDNEVLRVRQIYNEAWSPNWGFVPMTEDEFNFLAKRMKSVVVPKLAILAEIDGQPVGFGLSLPDLNQALIHAGGRLFPLGFFKLLYHSRKVNTIRIITLGVIPKYRHYGIAPKLYLETWKAADELGYRYGEMSWVLENNQMMNRSAEMLGGKIYKTYRMFEMSV